jgi:hypothetical protein
MSRLASKLDFAALILPFSLIAIGLAPTTALAQSPLPPCPFFTFTLYDCTVISAYPDGTYVGETRSSNRSGQGTFTWLDGRKYVGEWRHNKINGWGTLTWPNGQKYVGEFKDDKQDGQGTLTWENGDKYVGEFKDGFYDGQGTYTFADGRTQSGLWREGKLVTANSGFNPPISGLHPAGIPIDIEGGTFIVPVTINGQITLNFTIDSGAADVAVPADVVRTLIRTGSITKQDFLGEKQYVLADGSTVPSPVFVIRLLKVGDKILENVRATVTPVNGGLLLGQRFLNRFNSWSVDNKSRLLFLN